MTQEKSINFNVVKAIAKVSEKLKDSKLKIRKSAELTESVEKLNEYFGTDENETYMLCAIVSYCFDDMEEQCSVRDIARFFDCSIMTALTYWDDISSLVGKHYIRHNGSYRIAGNMELCNIFELNKELIDCILNNKPIEIAADETDQTVYGFFGEIAQLFDRLERRMRRGDISAVIDRAEENFAELEFISHINALVPDIEQRIFFYNVCNDFLKRDESDLVATLNATYGRAGAREHFAEFMNESNVLFASDLIEFIKKESINDATLTLTYNAKQMLLGDDLKYYTKSIKGADIISPDSIIHKDMFYSDENEHQMLRLKDIVSEDTFVQIQNRLTEKGMNKGVAVLLYGAPGTGKTESAFQIAKATGRKIL